MEVASRKNKNGSIALTIKKPTPFDAAVSRNIKAGPKTNGVYGIFKVGKVNVKKGESIELKL